MNAAVIVIDVQQALCEGIEAAFDCDGTISRINQVTRKARKVDDIFEADAFPALAQKLRGTVRRESGVEMVSMSYPLLVSRLLVKASQLPLTMRCAWPCSTAAVSVRW